MLENRFDPKWIYGDNIEQIKLVAFTSGNNFENQRRNTRESINTIAKYAL